MIQISEELFCKLYVYFGFENHDPQIYDFCKKNLEEKFEKLEKRQFFSKFANKNLSAAEREKAYQDYLKLKKTGV